MTKAKDGGYAAKRIARDMQDICLSNAELINAALDDLLDGDNDTRTAEKALNELALRNIEAFALQTRIEGGDLTEAELLAEKLAAKKRKSV